ncbi:hypothetical protein D3C79_768050 [compost metagenome]
MALDMRLCSLLQGLEQALWAQPVTQWQLAAGEHQHVAHLVLQFVQTLLEAAGETPAGLWRKLTLVLRQVAGIEHGCRQRRTYLMGQRSDHAPQRRQAFMACQLVLQATGFGQVVEQHQLAWLGIQRTRGNGQATAIAQ